MTTGEYIQQQALLPRQCPRCLHHCHLGEHRAERVMQIWIGCPVCQKSITIGSSNTKPTEEEYGNMVNQLTQYWREGATN